MPTWRCALPRDADLWLGDAYLVKLQAYFAEGNFGEAAKWDTRAVKMRPKAPILRALMAVCCTETGKSEEAARHMEVLQTFAPGFVPSILSGDFVLYKLPEHNALLVEDLRVLICNWLSEFSRLWFCSLVKLNGDHDGLDRPHSPPTCPNGRQVCKRPARRGRGDQ